MLSNVFQTVSVLCTISWFVSSFQVFKYLPWTLTLSSNTFENEVFQPNFNTVADITTISSLKDLIKTIQYH